MIEKLQNVRVVYCIFGLGLRRALLEPTGRHACEQGILVSARRRRGPLID
jgi:hypothetical protein